MSRLIVLAVSFLLFATSPLPAQGILQRVRHATHRDAYLPPVPPAFVPYTPPPPRPNPPRDPFASDDTDWDLGDLLTVAAFGVAGVTSPFWGPPLAFDAGLGTPGFFQHYPYAVPYAGYTPVGNDVAGRLNESNEPFGSAGHLKPWSVRLWAEGGDDFGGLSRASGGLFVDITSRWGVLTQWDYFSERYGGQRDETTFGTLNVTYRLAQAEWLQMHVGLGARVQVDRDDDQAGFNFVYRADVYPIQPLHLSGAFEVGNLGEALMLRGNALVGANWRNLEAFGGYDFYRIGRVNLQGPFVGLRVWF